MQSLRILLGQVLAGGYDKAARALPNRLRDLIIARDHGMCRTCRQPGTEIDHISGSSNDPANLQLLCDACHNKKTIAGYRAVTPGSPEGMKADWLRTRIASELPIQVCDRETEWERIEDEIRRVRKSESIGQPSLFE
jgi:hypothetical protein